MRGSSRAGQERHVEITAEKELRLCLPSECLQYVLDGVVRSNKPMLQTIDVLILNCITASACVRPKSCVELNWS